MQDSENVKNITHGQPVFISYPHHQDDEISLVDICRTLWQEKKIITAFFALCLLSALLMAFILPSMYRAEIILRPPLLEDVAGLQRFTVHTLDQHKVHHRFIVNLNSMGLRYRFFKENLIPEQSDEKREITFDEYEKFEAIFNKQINITSADRGSNDKENFFTNVSLDGRDRDVITDVLNRYIDFVDSFTVTSLIDEIDSQLNTKKKAIEAQIKELQLTARKELHDEIFRIKEALTVAKRLDFADFDAFFKMSGFDVKYPDLSIPYYRGYKALQEELNQMEKRKNNDAFVPGLRKLQVELAMLEEKKIDRDSIRSVRVDRETKVAGEPIKPKRNLIIALGGVAGLMLGVFAVFARKFIAEFTRPVDSNNAG